MMVRNAYGLRYWRRAATEGGLFPESGGDGLYIAGFLPPPKADRGAWRALEAKLWAAGIASHYTGKEFYIPTHNVSAVICRGRPPDALIAKARAAYDAAEGFPESIDVRTREVEAGGTRFTVTETVNGAPLDVTIGEPLQPHHLDALIERRYIDRRGGRGLSMHPDDTQGAPKRPKRKHFQTLWDVDSRTLCAMVRQRRAIWADVARVVRDKPDKAAWLLPRLFKKLAALDAEIEGIESKLWEVVEIAQYSHLDFVGMCGLDRAGYVRREHPYETAARTHPDPWVREQWAVWCVNARRAREKRYEWREANGKQRLIELAGAAIERIKARIRGVEPLETDAARAMIAALHAAIEQAADEDTAARRADLGIGARDNGMNYVYSPTRGAAMNALLRAAPPSLEHRVDAVYAWMAGYGWDVAEGGCSEHRAERAKRAAVSLNIQHGRLVDALDTAAKVTDGDKAQAIVQEAWGNFERAVASYDAGFHAFEGLVRRFVTEGAELYRVRSYPCLFRACDYGPCLDARRYGYGRALSIFEGWMAASRPPVCLRPGCAVSFRPDDADDSDGLTRAERRRRKRGAK